MSGLDELKSAYAAKLAKANFEAWCSLRNLDPTDPQWKDQHDLVLKDLRGILRVQS